MITYRKLPATGEWVAFGLISEIKVGPVVIHKRGGKTCDRIIDEVIPAEIKGKAYGFVTEHCKPESQRLADKRKRKHT